MNRLHDWHEKKNEHNRKVEVKQICSIVSKDLIKLIKLHCDFLERFSHGKSVYFDLVKLLHFFSFFFLIETSVSRCIIIIKLAH